MRLIDADALVEELEREVDLADDWKTAHEIANVVKYFPTIEPEQKKGKWKTAYLDHEAMGERPKVLYCSECNQCIAYPTHYCPNCGADMRGTE